MIRELMLHEKVHVRLVPGKLYGGTELQGTVIQKNRMPREALPPGHYSFFPRGSLVYIIQPELWNGIAGRHLSIRLGEHEIEEVKAALGEEERIDSAAGTGI